MNSISDEYKQLEYEYILFIRCDTFTFVYDQATNRISKHSDRI